jgi:acetyltransferase-like isoleucine patch superfamily enzyme
MLKKLKYIYPDGKSIINYKGFFRSFFMLIRGGLISLRLLRPIFLGQGARVEHIKFMYGSGIVKAEEQVTIQCISIQGVKLGSFVSLGAFSQLRPSSQYGGMLGEGCSIGNGTTFGPYTYIGCAGFIEIGSNCMFGPRVTLIAENHLITDRTSALKGAGVTRRGITIGDDCWIGANSVILDGACIGDGSVIGAGAVVTGIIPPYSIAVGSPARVIKTR